VFPVSAAAVNTTLFPEQIDVEPPAVTVALGLALTTTLVAVDVAEHPLAFVTVTEYDPAVVAVMLDVVAPVFHT
jgi:hypothetical protein